MEHGIVVALGGIYRCKGIYQVEGFVPTKILAHLRPEETYHHILERVFEPGQDFFPLDEVEAAQAASQVRADKMAIASVITWEDYWVTEMSSYLCLHFEGVQLLQDIPPYAEGDTEVEATYCLETGELWLGDRPPAPPTIKLSLIA